MFHTGTTGVGAGVRGGNGLHLKYGNPMPALDDLAADFPDLTIIGAHPSFPWQDEMLAIAVHKTNVYIDLSGWSPRYFSPQLVQYAKTLLQDRTLFGTDYPFLTPEQWLVEFDKLGFKPEVRQKILIDNARRLLAL
jgi:predicted TIM-barrel fold metal-dependent hydrolase